MKNNEITDKDILEYFIMKRKDNRMYFKKEFSTIKNGIIPIITDTKFNLYIEYLYTRFDEYYSIGSNKIYESIYRIFYKIEELKKCEVCGKMIPFTKTFIYKTCSEECGYKLMSKTNIGRKVHEETKEKIKKTNLEKYGVEYAIASDKVKKKIKETNIEKYGVENCMSNSGILKKRNKTNTERYGGNSPICSNDVKNKLKETNLNRYGVECVFQSDEIKKTIKNTNMKKYGVENPFSSSIIQEKIKQTNLERYGMENYQQSEEGRNKCIERFATGIPQQKDYETKKRNGSFKSSRPEKKLFSILKEIFGEENVIDEYKDERYPFKCDFYIKILDLFIELNLHYTHGGHPYNPNSEEDKKYLERYKNCNQIVDVWTVRDPKKLEIANKNKLNYIRIYNNDFDSDYIKEIISPYM